jgi:hypothetical protein
MRVRRKTKYLVQIKFTMQSKHLMMNQKGTKNSYILIREKHLAIMPSFLPELLSIMLTLNHFWDMLRK